MWWELQNLDSLNLSSANIWSGEGVDESKLNFPMTVPFVSEMRDADIELTTPDQYRMYVLVLHFTESV